MHKLLNNLKSLELNQYRDEFAELIKKADYHATHTHGLGKKFIQTLKQLPNIKPDNINLTLDSIKIGNKNQLNAIQQNDLRDLLMSFHPWRKGPFNIFGIQVESEWDSSLKWKRIQPHLSPLYHRKILDIGSSSGYYMFKMAEQNPRFILGVEPFISFYYQYLAIQHFAQIPQVYTIPTRLEDLPQINNYFDTIFCMGILYHRRSPLDFLKQMQYLLNKDGELVLETLTIPGEDEVSLTPKKRYAKMHNIFFIPTVNCLRLWLEKCGFCDIKFISTVATTNKEQRKTSWIKTESLQDFLNPKDNTKTIEGYPAPERTIFIAKKKCN